MLIYYKPNKEILKEKMYFLKLLTHLGLVNKMRKSIRLNKDTPHTVKASDLRRSIVFVAHVNCETNNDHHSTAHHRQLAMTQGGNERTVTSLCAHIITPKSRVRQSGSSPYLKSRVRGSRHHIRIIGR